MVDADVPDDLTVLVVDDEKEVADAYALRLQGYCDVTTAYDGNEALSIVEESTVDIVLLDRHMPDMSGDDVLAELDDRAYYGRVIMVTAVDPGFDVLGMPFDDYLCKPVDREDVRAAVNQQRMVLAFETLGEYFQAESKRAVITAETSADQRQDHERYADISRRADRLERRARRLLDDPGILGQFDRISRESF
jgi:DNA-binding response OmpR family regulator